MKDIGWTLVSTAEAHSDDIGCKYTFDFRPFERGKGKVRGADTRQEALYDYLREYLKEGSTTFFDQMPEDMREDWIRRLKGETSLEAETTSSEEQTTTSPFPFVCQGDTSITTRLAERLTDAERKIEKLLTIVAILGQSYRNAAIDVEKTLKL